jgi:hypothetical protein
MPAHNAEVTAVSSEIAGVTDLVTACGAGVTASRSRLLSPPVHESKDSAGTHRVIRLRASRFTATLPNR